MTTDNAVGKNLVLRIPEVRRLREKQAEHFQRLVIGWSDLEHVNRSRNRNLRKGDGVNPIGDRSSPPLHYKAAMRAAGNHQRGRRGTANLAKRHPLIQKRGRREIVEREPEIRAADQPVCFAVERVR